MMGWKSGYLSGLKINYSKSTLISLNITYNEGLLYAALLKCEMNKLSITYLEVPLHWKRLTSNNWTFLVSKIEKKLDGWKWELLSIEGRVILIRSVLCAIPLYWISIFNFFYCN
jgi:hypothetical protein